jgi:hypothetical protein
MTRKANDGIFIVYGPGNRLTPERSELKALRLAVRFGGDVKFVRWGQFVDEAESLGATPAVSEQQEMDA